MHIKFISNFYQKYQKFISKVVSSLGILWNSAKIFIKSQLCRYWNNEKQVKYTFEILRYFYMHLIIRCMNSNWLYWDRIDETPLCVFIMLHLWRCIVRLHHYIKHLKHFLRVIINLLCILFFVYKHLIRYI